MALCLIPLIATAKDASTKAGDPAATGAVASGTWVRVFNPPVEGRLEGSIEGLDVGDRTHVKLVGSNVQRGFIDFIRA